MPPWRLLAEDLRGKILSGEYEPGDRLPSAVTLHQETGLAVLTARKALRWLVDQGLAVQVTGMGTYVAARGNPGASDQDTTRNDET